VNDTYVISNEWENRTPRQADLYLVRSKTGPQLHVQV